ncbi:MAG TPA: FtsX-like permease family protein [Clostridia bacterium]|nr:FtsX-like permease family protein [Clostridia bacterium]
MAWIEKQRYLLDLALSSLLRRRGKNLALVLVFTTIVFVLASIFFFTGSIKREASLVLKGSPEVVVQKLVAGRHDLVPESYLTRISGLPGVKNARGRLWGYYFEPTVGANLTVMVSDADVVRQETMVIGKGVARTFQLQKGQVMRFQCADGTERDFRVAEVLSPESELLASDLVLVSTQDFQRLFGVKKGFYTDLVLEVRNSKETATVAEKIKRLLPDTRPILRSEILRTYEAIFDWRGGLLLFTLGGAALAFIIFAWDKATSLSFEERREIGILKAVGWETSEVIALKTWEGIVVSLTSFLIGTIAAYVHVFVASYVLFEPVLKGWSVLYPQFHLIPFVGPYELVALLFLTVVPYTAATIVPCWRAAIIDPDEVMRL